MIRLAIVEDEDNYAIQLEKYINKYEQESSSVFKVTRFKDGDEIVNNYKCQFDIILMDIEMKFMDGMSAAEEIRKVDKDVVIMFITNMTNYAIRGYQVDALDYVIKPVEYFAFSQKLDRALTRISKHKTKKSITIEYSSGIKKIDVDNIIYIETEGHNLLIHLKATTIKIRAKLKDYEEMLAEDDFFRINKGYLVNLKHVEGIEGTSCIIADEKLIISRNRKSDFMQTLVEYMSD
ncbi:two component transcriptional regulator, LytTR family [Lachnospiraceae bacterium C7]|nr:two component transcriptional regulator, LytTR family [Lachnospiraceae bacterium C7]